MPHCETESLHGSALFGAIGIQVLRADGGGRSSVTGKLLNLSLRGAQAIAGIGDSRALLTRLR